MTALDRVRRVADHSPSSRPRRALSSAVLASGLTLFWLVTAVAPAQGASLPAQSIQTRSLPLTDTDWSAGTPTSLANPLIFQKFDPSLGTLNSVTLSGTYAVAHSGTIRFDTAGSIDLAVTNQSVKLTRPDSSVLLSAAPADYGTTQSYAGPTFPRTFTVNPQTGTTAFTPTTLSGVADLAMFKAATAGETIRLPASASALGSSRTTSGNGFGLVTTQVGLDVTLTYNYTPVPEPGTLAVVGLGVAGWLFAARRRRLAAG